ncbi:MAG: chemotaxis protein CheB [Deferrisomatales bacterium]
MGRVVCIGGSTGAPATLAELVAALPEPFPLPIVVALHMPGSMTASFARTLATRTRLKVGVAQGGERLEPGNLYLAPGGLHLGLNRSAQLVVTPRPTEAVFKPSIDVLFYTAAQALGGSVVAVVLSGLSAGRDAVDGARAVKGARGQVLVIDDPANRFLGMPKSVIDAGAATLVGPLPKLVEALCAGCR